MEIDLTKEVSGRRPSATHARHRLVVAALVVGLAGGGFLGAAAVAEPEDAGGGAVVFTGADLRIAGRVVVLRWSMANFSSAVATVDSALIDGRPAEFGPPDIPGKSVAEFTTPLRCGGDPPQLNVVVSHGDGQRDEVGYLVDRPEWNRLCG
ncbi:hypothetical protein M1L60_35615 [Actinoplanes sp. TRM 88003]|uniref:Uncharacterized protein n=1 Tax=Paractinoplanes aksuensis TaxID=2939490 RepID=A0ABT1E268_9ACTN|nr:hypothetical protein [Actinoplanes aksuensis]MCO8275921.1 hypothetical protein [Actinoplanes aksuensis]